MSVIRWLISPDTILQIIMWNHVWKRYPMMVHFICFHLCTTVMESLTIKHCLSNMAGSCRHLLQSLKNLQAKQKKQELRYVWHRFSIRVLPSSIYVILRMRDSLVPCLESSGRKITCQERQMSVTRKAWWTAWNISKNGKTSVCLTAATVIRQMMVKQKKLL